MSTDVKLHILTDPTNEEEVNYFNGPLNSWDEHDRWSNAFLNVAQTPYLSIGEDSMSTSEKGMKAIFAIRELVGHDPIELTEDLLVKILTALPEDIDYYQDWGWEEGSAEAFLRKYLGYKVFVISW